MATCPYKNQPQPPLLPLQGREPASVVAAIFSPGSALVGAAARSASDLTELACLPGFNLRIDSATLFIGLGLGRLLLWELAK